MTGTLDRIKARNVLSLTVEERDALVEVAKAAQPALELLAAEGYDRHHEGGFPVCAEYENLAAALARLEDNQ